MVMASQAFGRSFRIFGMTILTPRSLFRIFGMTLEIGKKSPLIRTTSLLPSLPASLEKLLAISKRVDTIYPRWLKPRTP